MSTGSFGCVIQTALIHASVHPSSRADCPLKGNLSVQQASHTPFKHLKLQTDTSRLESINRLTERVDQKVPTRLTRLRSFTTLPTVSPLPLSLTVG